MHLIWNDTFKFEMHDPLYQIYKNEWWTEGRSHADVIRAFENSDIFISCLTSDGELIAFARILTDFTFKAIIFDLIVDANSRGQNIGEQLLSKIISHDQLKSVQSFELYCPDHIAPFYEKFGFERSSSKLLRLARSTSK